MSTSRKLFIRAVLNAESPLETSISFFNFSEGKVVVLAQALSPNSGQEAETLSPVITQTIGDPTSILLRIADPCAKIFIA